MKIQVNFMAHLRACKIITSKCFTDCKLFYSDFSSMSILIIFNFFIGCIFHITDHSVFPFHSHSHPRWSESLDNSVFSSSWGCFKWSSLVSGLLVPDCMGSPFSVNLAMCLPPARISLTELCNHILLSIPLLNYSPSYVLIQ